MEAELERVAKDSSGVLGDASADSADNNENELDDVIYEGDADSDQKSASDEKKKSGDDDDEDKKPFWKDILELFLYFCAVLVISILIVTFVGQRTIVDGPSMSPTLSDGDNLIVDKISYRFNDPQRYDVIVFPYQHAKKTYYIKRIIGLPGEEVYIDPNGTIYINGNVLHETFGAETMIAQGRADTPIKLGEDEYFVLGDNRNNSSDSRDYMVGNINRKDIIGRAWVRIYPFNSIGKVKHTMDD